MIDLVARCSCRCWDAPRRPRSAPTARARRKPRLIYMNNFARLAGDQAGSKIP